MTGRRRAGTMAAALAALAVLAGCGVMGDPVPPAPKGYYGQR